MKIKHKLCGLVLCLMLAPSSQLEAQKRTLSYRAEAIGMASDGQFAPLWFTANRHGVLSNQDAQAALRAGIFYRQELNHQWNVQAGFDLNWGAGLLPDFGIQQAYADISWKELTLSIGAKERIGGPLDKNPLLTGGWMVEGPNTRPVPQARLELDHYWKVPGLHEWVALKGHIAYGRITDDNWQRDFVGANQKFVQDVLYHSKSLMFRIGRRQSIPVEFEFGMITGSQFGGKRYKKEADGTIRLQKRFPNGFKEFFKVFIPKQNGTIENVGGNHCGSWNFALNVYAGEWKFRTYLEHYFEDHSQMFWEYGRWKDGQLGFEVSLPKNRWLSSVVWEGLSTKDQTGSILYDGVGGSFTDVQVSGNDHYYNNHEYLGWQYYGSSLGHPFLYGPQYNSDRSNSIKSTRIRSNHLGLQGQPANEWKWRLLASFVRHWGTYFEPLDKQRKQFSSMLEVTYQPQWIQGWSASLSLGLDRGNYLGNNTGAMLTLRKVGGFNL